MPYTASNRTAVIHYKEFRLLIDHILSTEYRVIGESHGQRAAAFSQRYLIQCAGEIFPDALPYHFLYPRLGAGTAVEAEISGYPAYGGVYLVYGSRNRLLAVPEVSSDELQKLLEEPNATPPTEANAPLIALNLGIMKPNSPIAGRYHSRVSPSNALYRWAALAAT